MINQLKDETKKIAENEFYSLFIDKYENRAYLTIKGFWKNPECIPDYLNDWSKGILLLQKGFTVLTDVTEMEIHPSSVRSIHAKAQQLIIDGGVYRVAEVQENTMSAMQLDGVAHESKMPRGKFTRKLDALNWLES